MNMGVLIHLFALFIDSALPITVKYMTSMKY